MPVVGGSTKGRGRGQKRFPPATVKAGCSGEPPAKKGSKQQHHGNAGHCNVCGKAATEEVTAIVELMSNQP